MSQRTAQFLRLLSAFVVLSAFAPWAGGQQASLIGTVLADSTERPVVDAEVVIAALNMSTRTDSAGNFSLLRLPAGTYLVMVRAVGRLPHRETVTLGATDRIERDFLLKRSAKTLADVEVRASAVPVDLRLAQFEERRKQGFGRFITQDLLQKAEGRQLGNFLSSRIPGLRGASIGGSQNAMASTRGAISLSKTPAGDLSDAKRGATPQCYVQVIVDGIVRYRSQPGEKLFDINTILPEQLAGVEYYTTSTTPQQYNSTGTPCGTLVIWTKMR